MSVFRGGKIVMSWISNTLHHGVIPISYKLGVVFRIWKWVIINFGHDFWEVCSILQEHFVRIILFAVKNIILISGRDRLSFLKKGIFSYNTYGNSPIKHKGFLVRIPLVTFINYIAIIVIIQIWRKKISPQQKALKFSNRTSTAEVWWLTNNNKNGTNETITK